MGRRVSMATVVLLAVVFGASPARASVYTLTPGNISDLSTFLGEGPLTLTSIFSKETGDGKTGTAFHAAVDLQGRTFTVIQATPAGSEISHLFGGYNPVSWNAPGPLEADASTVTPNDADRTAFLFNLDTSTKQAQKLGGDEGNAGQYQTGNFSTLGPIFGLYDIYFVDPSLDTLGYLYQHAYGGIGQNGDCIVPGSCYAQTWPDVWQVAGFQVYTIAPAAPAEVPEPASLFLMGTGVLGLIEYRRRQGRKQ